jgi:C4-dicarboxylate-specific signal transduction histidine kinase
MSQHGGSSPPGNAAGTTPTAAAPARSSANTTAQRQAAAQLAGLLAQSGADRGAVNDAVVNVQGCGKSLRQDAQTLSRAAANRRGLLSRLSSLPGRSALPGALVAALTGAWQASAQADADLAEWASNAASHNCHKGNSNNASLQASYGPDSQATSDKQAFVRLWNPLARHYGLTTYQSEQL